MNDSHAVTIRDSVAEVGHLYPVLVDQHGRILDGKHRLRADPGWIGYKKTIRIEDDAQALAIARWANSGTPLPPKVERRIEELVLGAKTAAERQRDRIREALLAEAGKDKPLSHNAIAKQLGVHPELVNRECLELITHCVISECPHRFTVTGKTAPGPKPKAEPKRKITDVQVEEIIAEDLSWPQIMERYGVGQGAAQNARTRAAAIAEERDRLASLPVRFMTGAEEVARGLADEQVDGEFYAGSPMPGPEQDYAPQERYPAHACPVCNGWHEDARNDAVPDGR